MKLICQRAYFFLWGVPVFVVCMLVYTTFILVSLALIPDRHKGGRVAYFWLSCWGFTFNTATGIFFKTYDHPDIKRKKPYVYACNHNSFLDGIMICLTVPTDFRPLGKTELTKIPVFGWMYRYVVILVDRKSMASRQKSMLEMQKHLSEGISILIFPEGTMNQTNDLLQIFRNGTFQLAIDTQIPVVPMVLWGTRACMPRRPKFTLSPGIIKTYFLEPISTTGLTKENMEELKMTVYNRILAKLEELEGISIHLPHN